MRRVLTLLFLVAFVSGCADLLQNLKRAPVGLIRKIVSGDDLRTTNPITGRKQMLFYTEPQMIQLGAVSYAERAGPKSKVRLIPSGARYDALQRVGHRVAAAVNKSDKWAFKLLDLYKWEFRLIDNVAANAWALPGGKIAFFTGLFPILEDEASMAIVMGHEIMHALLSHGNERMSQSGIEEVVLTAAEIGFQNNKDRKKILAALGAGITYGLILPYSRLQESEADKQGLFLAARAGYDPAAAIGFWERMDKKSAGKRDLWFKRTHPDPKNRVQNLRKWMKEAKSFYAQSRKAENRALPPIPSG